MSLNLFSSLRSCIKPRKRATLNVSGSSGLYACMRLSVKNVARDKFSTLRAQALHQSISIDTIN